MGLDKHVLENYVSHSTNSDDEESSKCPKERNLKGLMESFRNDSCSESDESGSDYKSLIDAMSSCYVKENESKPVLNKNDSFIVSKTDETKKSVSETVNAGSIDDAKKNDIVKDNVGIKMKSMKVKLPSLKSNKKDDGVVNLTSKISQLTLSKNADEIKTHSKLDKHNKENDEKPIISNKNEEKHKTSLLARGPISSGRSNYRFDVYGKGELQVCNHQSQSGGTILEQPHMSQLDLIPTTVNYLNNNNNFYNVSIPSHIEKIEDSYINGPFTFNYTGPNNLTLDELDLVIEAVKSVDKKKSEYNDIPQSHLENIVNDLQPSIPTVSDQILFESMGNVLSPNSYQDDSSTEALTSGSSSPASSFSGYSPLQIVDYPTIHNADYFSDIGNSLFNEILSISPHSSPGSLFTINSCNLMFDMPNFQDTSNYSYQNQQDSTNDGTVIPQQAWIRNDSPKSAKESLVDKFGNLKDQQKRSILRNIPNISERDLLDYLDSILDRWNKNNYPQYEFLYFICQQLLQKTDSMKEIFSTYENGHTILDRAILTCPHSPLLIKYLAECMIQVLSILKNDGLNLKLCNKNILHEVVKMEQGYMESIKPLLLMQPSLPFSVDDINLKGNAPLHIACIHVNNVCKQITQTKICSRQEMVRILLEDGKANPNIKDRTSGDTPLHIAVNVGECAPGLVTMLLNYGADPKIKNLRQYTPLDLIRHFKRPSSKEHEKIVFEILKKFK